MGGGDDAPSPPPYRPPPPQQELMDVIDEITGTQSVVVKGADGKKVRRIERLPRTPEEQERFQLGERLIKSSIDAIKTLYKYNPRDVVSYAPLIKTFSDINDERAAALARVADIGNIKEDIQSFRDMQSALDDDMFMRQDRQTEENLARKGLSDSYAGQEARAFAERNQNLVRKQSEFNANLYGEELAAKRLNRNAQAFALDETGRAGRLQSAQAEFQLQKDQRAEAEAKRQTALAEQSNMLNIGSNLVGQDFNKAAGGQTPFIANQTFQMQNADSLNRYNAGINAENMAYRNQVNAYNNRPPSFGQDLFRMGARAVGNYFGGPVGGEAAGQFVK